jgi:formamidopyrimidine-DNA glycosylase
MEGARFKKVEVRRRDLRWPLPRDFAKRLEGQRVEGVGRRAKYLTVDVSSGDVLLMHLGMSGSFRVVKDHGKELQPGSYHFDKGKLEKHDHVVFHMSNGSVVTFNQPPRFGMMKIVPPGNFEHEPLLRWLGPEPLGNRFDAEMLASACAGKKTSLKAALLDQTVVAGIGNIYACEALFRARLSPKRRASTIADRGGKPNDKARALVDAIKAVLHDAIKAGGSSLRDHRRADGSLGDFQHNFLVYDREGKPCPNSCSGKVKRFTQNGRSTFWCPSCQK